MHHRFAFGGGGVFRVLIDCVSKKVLSGGGVFRVLIDCMSEEAFLSSTYRLDFMGFRRSSHGGVCVIFSTYLVIDNARVTL